MTQAEAVKILDAILANSAERIKTMPADRKLMFVSNKIYLAINSCFDWRKEEGLKFKGDKVFYKDIEIKNVT